MPDDQNAVDMSDLKRRMDGAVAAFRSDLASLRTGRASSSLLDAVVVPAYGSDMPIDQLATITVPEPRMLSVQVWDASLAGAVEKAIRNSGLGLNPISAGANLRIPLPELNEERRKSLVKLAHQYAENARIAARHVRRDGIDGAKKAEKDGALSEDASRKLGEDVQKMTDNTITAIDALLSEKETEIMQV